MPPINYRDEVAKRLRELADKHGGVSAFAAELGMPQPRMSQYVTGVMLPGNKMRGRIRELLGEDAEFYIMYGTREEIDAKSLDAILNMFKANFKDDYAIIEAAKKHGITSAEQLDWILEARHMILNEPKPEYKTKGRKK